MKILLLLVLLALPVPSLAQPASVDLLHAVRADLAVSSVYRDQAYQAASLVDGDLETAWNSRTGDLAGAWIEARLPADVAVTEVALTAGFTHRTERSDLFTGNHRVARVRISRDGHPIGEHDLDTSSRELQHVPITGAGGVYRIEIVGVTPGSNASWRETCISELQILGRAPRARAGERFPRLGVGQLPAPRPEPGSVAATSFAGRAHAEIDAFARAWQPFEADQRGEAATSMGPRSAGDVPLASFRRTRRQALTRVAELTDLADEVRADQLRAAAARQTEWTDVHRNGWTGAMQDADLDTVHAAFESVIASLGPEVRCQWARAHVGLRIQRVAWTIRNRNYYYEMAEGYDDPLSAADRREEREVERAWERFEPIARRWPREATRVTHDLDAFTYPATLPQEDWTALRAQLAVVSQACH